MSTVTEEKSFVVWKTAIDERTCPRCKKLNNKIFDSDEVPRRGECLPNESANKCTHSHCRCRVVNYIKPSVQSASANGPAYWQVMFDKAYGLPEEVNKNQRLKFRQEIQSLVKSYPCTDCVSDTINWMRFNKPTGEKREDYVNYLCEMKNMVNAKTDKPLYDCSTLTTNNMHNSQTSCQSCQQTDTEPGSKEKDSKVNPELGTSTSEERGIVTPDLVSSTTEDGHEYGKPNEIEIASED